MAAQIKPEHVLLTVEDLLYGYINKTRRKDEKRAATGAITALTGTNRSISHVYLPSGNIYYLPQLLSKDSDSIESLDLMGRVKMHLVKAAVEDLGYSMGDLASNIRLNGLQLEIDKQAQNFSEAIKEKHRKTYKIENRFDLVGERQDKKSAYNELRNMAKTGLIEILDLTQEVTPVIPTEQRLSSAFNLPEIIQSALMQQLDLEQAPDPKTEVGKAFQNAVLHVTQSIEDQASLIKQACPGFDKK